VPQTFDLDGKAIVVTGGGRGLGRGMARALAEAGARVMLAARTQEQLDRTVQEIRDRGGVATALRTDVTDSSQVDALIAACIREFGRLDVVFANAGVGGGTDAEFWEYPDWAFEDVLAVNLKSAFYTCRAASRAMIAEGRGGVLVTTSSAGGLRASKRWAYAVAKGGVLSLTKVMAGMLATHGIRVNCIVPGIVQQDDPHTEPERAARARRGAFTPAMRLGEWWEVGPLAVFLASDASSYITGQNFFIDGGMLNGGLAPVSYRPHHELPEQSG
jgi:NAD(P)-dependent dehydrogenase (short-subunit alcohol dehydrogenase family)